MIPVEECPRPTHQPVALLRAFHFLLVAGLDDAVAVEVGLGPRDAFEVRGALPLRAEPSPRDEQTYGVAKLDAALGYIEAKLGKPLAHPPLPVSLDRLRIPTAGGGSKPLESATFAELVAATGKLTNASHKKPRTPARAAIEKALGGVSSLAGVRVSESHGSVTFGPVPLAALARFASALAKVKLP